jgi:alpha-1,3-rhamnosyl/mannosyltransferase
VNLLWLVPGVVGGTEDYAVRLLGALAAHPHPSVQVTLFANRMLASAHPDLVARFPTTVAPISGSSRPLRVGAESTWLAAAARLAGVDLVHHPGGTVPLVRSRPSVVTIHDLQPLVRAETFSPRKRAYLRARLGPSVRAARLVMTVSEHARRSIVDLLGAEPDRVVIVNAPVPRRDLGGGPQAGAPSDPYILYPAITYPHKNHVVLVRAFARLAATHPRVRLVLTGGAGGAEEAVAAEIARLGIAERVDRLGRVPRAELDGLVSGATALAYPSRYEGFGLPVLEAMAAGCPVVVAAATALPEVVGDAGVLVDPDDEQGWADALAALLDDPARRADLAVRGLARAECYTPAAASIALVNAYLRAAAADGGSLAR